MFGLAITVFKAQGMTLRRVILALSYRSSAVTNLSYEALYVAFSRVRKRDDIRIIVSEPGYDTLTYITDKKPDPSSTAFFAGYDSNGIWQKHLALSAAKQLGLTYSS